MQKSAEQLAVVLHGTLLCGKYAVWTLFKPVRVVDNFGVLEEA